MTTIEGKVSGRRSNFVLRIHDKNPGNLIEPYFQDESIAGVDLTFHIVTPLGKLGDNDYLQAVVTMEAKKKDLRS